MMLPTPYKISAMNYLRKMLNLLDFVYSGESPFFFNKLVCIFKYEFYLIDRTKLSSYHLGFVERAFSLFQAQAELYVLYFTNKPVVT